MGQVQKETSKQRSLYPSNAHWVSRSSVTISDFQIGMKGGNGIKVNGKVTANRFRKKKSRK